MHLIQEDGDLLIHLTNGKTIVGRQGLLPNDSCLSRVHAEFFFWEEQGVLICIPKSRNSMFLEKSQTTDQENDNTGKKKEGKIEIFVEQPCLLQPGDKLYFLATKYIFTVHNDTDQPSTTHSENPTSFYKSSAAVWKSLTDISSDYLTKHNIHQELASLKEILMQEQPKDPLKFSANWFKERIQGVAPLARGGTDIVINTLRIY